MKKRCVLIFVKSDQEQSEDGGAILLFYGECWLDFSLGARNMEEGKYSLKKQSKTAKKILKKSNLACL